MGEIKLYRCEYGYRIVEWAPNRKRLKQLRRKVQGPQQLYWMYMHWDQTQKYVYPSKKHVIKKFRKCNGEVINIYNTDSTRFLDSDYDDYKLHEDIEKMERVIQDKEIPKEKRTDKLLKDIYGDPICSQPWRREPDPIYD